MACASRRSAASTNWAWASAVRRPPLTTVPTARTRPVSTVTGRRNFTVRSSDVYAIPCGSVDWTAQPAAESSSVANTPPCMLPMGL
ncbi:hypothetical protein SHO565_56200 [Streptomyces sp. HO565]